MRCRSRHPGDATIERIIDSDVDLEASLLISAGANPKAVQVHLGHRSIAVTMDRYTHMFPSDTEALIGRLDDARSRALTAPPPPSSGPRVVGLDRT